MAERSLCWYSEDSFTPSEFELTDYLKDGQNKLAAQVFKWTSSSWCEDQDFFRFSGIYRDVYLYTVPDTHAYDLQIRAIPEENLDVADLEIKVKTWGKGSIAFRLEQDGEYVLEEKKSLTEAGNEEANAEPFYIQKTNSSKTVQNSFAWKSIIQNYGAQKIRSFMILQLNFMTKQELFRK